MNKSDVRQKISEVGVVPVIRATSAAHARAGCEAVCAGGIPIVEITMTVPGAIQVIAELSISMSGDVLIGAGTVLDADTAGRCVDAGAVFLVSPGFDGETVRFANRNGVLIMSGALTPTEVMTAWKAGTDIVKVFPCGNVGGPKYIKALKGPFPQIPMVPTGGVNLNTAADFIRAGAEALGIGGELVDPAALQSGRTESITEAARQYVRLIREAREAVSQAAQSAAH